MHQLGNMLDVLLREHNDMLFVVFGNQLFVMVKNWECSDYLL